MARTGPAMPNPQDMQTLMGLFGSGRLAEAEATARRLGRKFPEFYFLHNVLGAILSARGMPLEALASFGRALALNPDFADARYNAGIALHALGRQGEAIASFEIGRAHV